MDVWTRITPKAKFEDTGLTNQQKRQLREIVKTVNQRSSVVGERGVSGGLGDDLGVFVLFAGVSGTGKTVAAEILAGELSSPLYRIDLSQVMNKYIDETEKNLSRLFDKAQASGAILFFDEADALFGKRSEVHTAPDRYSRINAERLLHRLKSHCGLVVLSALKEDDINQSFMRRIRFTVDFPVPDKSGQPKITKTFSNKT
jgi:SpoVK/Ycf46/Vps4 family AAA+-type ATPase